jgi:hypothetical protein
MDKDVDRKDEPCWRTMTLGQKLNLLRSINEGSVKPREIAKRISVSHQRLSKQAKTIRDGGCITGKSGRPKVLDVKAMRHGVINVLDTPVDKRKFKRLFDELYRDTKVRRLEEMDNPQVSELKEIELSGPSKRSRNRYLRLCNDIAQNFTHRDILPPWFGESAVATSIMETGDITGKSGSGEDGYEIRNNANNSQLDFEKD